MCRYKFGTWTCVNILESSSFFFTKKQDASTSPPSRHPPADGHSPSPAHRAVCRAKISMDGRPPHSFPTTSSVLCYTYVHEHGRRCAPPSHSQPSGASPLTFRPILGTADEGPVSRLPPPGATALSAARGGRGAMPKTCAGRSPVHPLLQGGGHDGEAPPKAHLHPVGPPHGGLGHDKAARHALHGRLPHVEGAPQLEVHVCE